MPRILSQVRSRRLPEQNKNEAIVESKAPRNGMTPCERSVAYSVASPERWINRLGFRLPNVSMLGTVVEILSKFFSLRTGPR